MADRVRPVALQEEEIENLRGILGEDLEILPFVSQLLSALLETRRPRARSRSGFTASQFRSLRPLLATRAPAGSTASPR
jgi:hypothetical protein